MLKKFFFILEREAAPSSIFVKLLIFVYKISIKITYMFNKFSGKIEVDQNNFVSLLEAERTLGNPNFRKYICEEVIDIVTIKTTLSFLDSLKSFI